MDRERVLGAVSAVQLSTGIAGLVIALRRRHPFHLPLLHGHDEYLARDSVVMGTAFSPPLIMLGAQAAATIRVLRGGNGRTRTVLGALGAIMTAGYLGEQLVRRRLQRTGWDPVESPVVVLGITTAAIMAGLGLKSRGKHP